MSWRATAWASEQVTGSPVSKSVLWKLADNANDHGVCWPSIPTIARHTELSERTVQQHLNRLEALGLIRIERRFGDRGEPVPSVFHLAMPQATAAKAQTPQETRKKIGLGGGAGDSPPPHQIHQGGAAPAPGGESDGVAYKDEPSMEPSIEPLTSAPAGARESGEILSMEKGQPGRFQEFVDAVAQTWPGGFPKDNLTASSKAWDRETRIHAADLLIECARLHGREKARLQESRTPAQGKLLMAPPSRFLQNGTWKGYVQDHANAREAETKIVSALGNVQRGLGAEMFTVFRDRLEFSDAALAQLDGVEFIGGDHPVFKVTNYGAKIMLENRAFRIARLLGVEEVAVHQVPAVKVG